MIPTISFKDTRRMRELIGHARDRQLIEVAQDNPLDWLSVEERKQYRDLEDVVERNTDNPGTQAGARAAMDQLLARGVVRQELEKRQPPPADQRLCPQCRRSLDIAKYRNGCPFHEGYHAAKDLNRKETR